MSPVGVAVMAYGTPASLDDLEAYYTHIRRGRPPTTEQLAELRARYEAILPQGPDGEADATPADFPLRRHTLDQVAAVQRGLDELEGPGTFVTALGQKHAAPFIEDAVTELVDRGCRRIVGLVLAPHYSAFGVGQYHARAAEVAGLRGIPYDGIRHWHLEPAYLEFLAEAVRQAGATLPEGYHLVFTAHSLPERALAGDPYPDELRQSAAAVAARLDRQPWSGWGLGWQSAGRTPEPWRGPDILAILRDLGEAIPASSDRGGPDRRGVLVCPQGFVADHLEVLYDLDIEARRVADEQGLAFARTRSINDDPTVMTALAQLVAGVAAAHRAGPEPGAGAHGDAGHRPPADGPTGTSSPTGTNSTTGTVRVGGSGGRRRRRVAVVGAGIAGLTAAHTLLEGDPDLEVVVLDGGRRTGGKIRTTEIAHRAVDCGADAFLARHPAAVGLCRRLGLGDELVTPATRTAYLWLDGGLRPFPPGLVLGVPTDLDAVEASGLLSEAGLVAVRRDLDEPGPPLHGDEAVGAFVRRRVGDEVFERLVSPLLSGVNAGDADQLSIELGAASLAAAGRLPGSLVENLRAATPGPPPAAAGAGSDEPPPVFYGLRGGTQTLTDALTARIEAAGGAVRLDTPLVELDEQLLPGRSSALYRLRTERGPGAWVDVDGVVLAAPGPATARLLAHRAPAVAELAAAVEYASVVLITLAVPSAAVRRDLDGSGFLVHPSPEVRITACSWASSKWAHLAPDGDDRVLLRVSLGGTSDPEAVKLPDARLLEIVAADLATTMGIVIDPDDDRLAVRISRWDDALPQFRPGHGARVDAAEAELADRHPHIVLAGAWLRGLGIPACIQQATDAAGRLLASW